tara:strand:+ start:245 stop:1309 length:1065 start_codon:yes stop_codon:yes gene_type:complete
MKIHNFSAGPSILPKEVMHQASEAVKELDNSGLSLIEISHRSSAFISIMDEACSLALKLTGLENKGYKSIFVQGGASLQFLMTAYNFLNKKAGYVNTGTWSEKAIKEAKLFGEVQELASSKEANYNFIPKGYEIPNDLDYLHLTTNNTIFGTQVKDIPETKVPLIADMSSDIFSRKFDYSKFDCFYAGAQKNMGPAGTTLVIIKEEILNKIANTVPSMLSYKIQAEKDSMFNTPPVFAVYTSMLNMRWVDSKGGIEKLGENNMYKAKLLYGEIDRNSKFIGFAAKEDRSDMNATFNLVNKNDTEAFDRLCNAAGISGHKGHRSVGGYRASMYNALPIESVDVLVECMQSLEKNK